MVQLIGMEINTVFTQNIHWSNSAVSAHIDSFVYRCLGIQIWKGLEDLHLQLVKEDAVQGVCLIFPRHCEFVMLEVLLR